MLAAIGRLAPALITAQQACCLRLDVASGLLRDSDAHLQPPSACAFNL